MKRARSTAVALGLIWIGWVAGTRAAGTPPPEAFRVLESQPEPGPRITPFLRYQLDKAWRQDEARRGAFAAVRTKADLRALQARLRESLLDILGGLPERTPLHAKIVGSVAGDGY